MKQLRLAQRPSEDMIPVGQKRMTHLNKGTRVARDKFSLWAGIGLV